MGFRFAGESISTHPNRAEVAASTIGNRLDRLGGAHGIPSFPMPLRGLCRVPLIALAAVTIPAIRAARVEPIMALRDE